MTPVLPPSGEVEIAGTVTNVSDDTFTRVNLHAFSSEQPIPDALSLSQSALIDPTLFVGDRVTVPGTFDTIDELAPGESATVRRLGARRAPGHLRRAGRLLDRDPRARRQLGPARPRRRRPGPHVHPPRAVRRRPGAGGLGDPPRSAAACGSTGTAPSPAPNAGPGASRRAAASTACSTWPTRPARRRTPGWSTPPCSTHWRDWRGATRRAPWLPTPTCPARNPHPPSRRRTARRRPPRPARRSSRPSRSPPRSRRTRRRSWPPPPRHGWSGSSCSWARHRC